MKKVSNNSERVRFSDENLSWGLHFRLCIVLLRGAVTYRNTFDVKFTEAVLTYIDGLQRALEENGHFFKSEIN